MKICIKIMANSVSNPNPSEMDVMDSQKIYQVIFWVTYGYPRSERS